MTQPQQNDAALIAELNDLLQLDHDAVEAYTIAIDLVRSPAYRETLVQYRADHKRHIEELAALVRARGGLPTELPHPTAPLKLAVQALGAAPGDTTLLLAFKAVEGQGRDKYRRAAQRSHARDVAEVIHRAAEDENRHYQWCEQTLTELGVGAGTIPHGIATVVETVHKILADPIEATGRKVMEQVGRAVGTTRTRGGSAAPSPADAAAAATPGTAAGGPAGSAGTGPMQQAPIFIDALRALEDSGDVERMVALYADDADTKGPADHEPHVGPEGARRFWRMYRDSFQAIRSTFTKVSESPDGTVTLEWTSEGRLVTGGAVRYAGTSIVEMRDGRVRRFHTYFDTRELEQHLQRGAGETAARADEAGRPTEWTDYGESSTM